MNVRCPACRSTYRVDPERVPERGVRTRCSACSAVFTLERAGVGVAPAVGSAPPPTAPPADPSPAPTAPRPTAPPAEPSSPAPAAPPPTAPPAEPSPAPAAPALDEPSPASGAPDAGPAAAPPPPGIAAATPAPSPSLPRAKPVFGQQDPDTRAKRIARALVSDMVVYNGGRRDASLAAGTLKADFREEILKSWEEYVEQVGAEMARKTPHFRDALNAILGKGQAVF